MQRLVNLTPHPIVFEDGRILPKCENPPRLNETMEKLYEVEGISVFRKLYDVSGCSLPPSATRCINCGELADSRGNLSVVDEGTPGGLGPCGDAHEFVRVLFIVPLLIAQVFAGKRIDLLVVNDPIRDSEGHVVGCRSLASV